MRGSLITGCQELAGLLKMLLALQLPGLEYFTDPSLETEKKVILITKAVVALHNFLMKLNERTSSYGYCPASYVDLENAVGTTPGKRKHAHAEGSHWPYWFK